MKYQNNGNMMYPIGKFSPKPHYTISDFKENLEVFRSFPLKLNQLEHKFTEKVLASTYRENGWTAQQVIHHIADSHTNMLIRLKWSLTEDKPQIKAYYEAEWAQLGDYGLPIVASIKMIELIHLKAHAILQNLKEQDLEKGYWHPQADKFYTLKEMVALYAWHGSHHLAHINICIDKVTKQ